MNNSWFILIIYIFITFSYSVIVIKGGIFPPKIIYQKWFCRQFYNIIFNFFYNPLFFFLMSYTLNLNVLGAYLYAKNNEIKQYAIQNTIVAIPKENICI